jgi:hypothetical protein
MLTPPEQQCQHTFSHVATELLPLTHLHMGT